VTKGAKEARAQETGGCGPTAAKEVCPQRAMSAAQEVEQQQRRKGQRRVRGREGSLRAAAACVGCVGAASKTVRSSGRCGIVSSFSPHPSVARSSSLWKSP
jgi:hypothetical protein